MQQKEKFLFRTCIHFLEPRGCEVALFHFFGRYYTCTSICPNHSEAWMHGSMDSFGSNTSAHRFCGYFFMYFFMSTSMNHPTPNSEQLLNLQNSLMLFVPHLKQCFKPSLFREFHRVDISGFKRHVPNCWEPKVSYWGNNIQYST